jgi:hypothetical protein
MSTVGNRTDAATIAAIPAMGTPEMQITSRSSVIGGIPKPEARGTEWRKPTVRSSVKPSHADNLIRRTRQVWQPRLGRDLSREDARQITENLTGFFALLAEWSRAEMLTAANSPGEPSASDNQEAPARRNGRVPP